jgi:phenylacetate-CoA ligase
LSRRTRQFLFRAKERVLDRDMFRVLEELEDSQWLGREELRERQLTSLRRLIPDWTARVPHYRSRFVAHPFGARSSFADFSNLPRLTRKDVVRAGKSLIAENAAGRIAQTSTSGSTGIVLHFYTAAKKGGYSGAARIRAWRWWGLEYGMKVYRLWARPWLLLPTLRGRFIAYANWWKNRATGTYQASALETRDEQLAHRCEELRRFRPEIIYGYGVSIYLLAEYIERTGESILPCRPKVVICTSEMLFDPQKQLISRVFDAPCVCDYSAAEAGLIAHECPAGSLHIADENLYLETLDESGETTEAGPGRLLFTDLRPSRTPFIRYELGDIVELAPPEFRCPCGRGLRVIQSLVGRSEEVFRRRDGSPVLSPIFSYIVRDVPGLRRWQVRASRLNSVRILLETTPEELGMVRARILRGLRTHVGEDFSYSVEAVSEIPPDKPGKFRCVVLEEEDDALEEGSPDP